MKDANPKYSGLSRILRLAEGTMFTLGGAIFAAICIQLYFDRFRASTSSVEGLAVVILVLSATYFFSQYSQVEEELAARTERSAAYVEELYSGRLRYRGKVHRTIGRLVRNAQHEILVLTSMETENKYADDRKRKALLRMYRSAVLRHKHDAFTYTRVIQVQIPDKAEQSEVTEGYLRAQLQRLSSTTASHCTWALQFSQKLTPGVPIDDPHPVIDIVAMPMKLPVTLILIDHRYVVIMTEAVAQDGNRYLGSALIVEDTTGRTRSLGSLYHRYFDTFVEVAYQIKESDLPDKKARKAADTQSSKE